ncbi:MAG TPA: hypothetical protein VN770_09850 [Gaiellaceae bacterium]|nr:hypothetical protein [Gaiellaceae bacterium]
MSGFVQARTLFGRRSAPRSIHPEEWPEQSGKTRVLIENPDRADLWAHADLLREEGYDVAMCEGPTAETAPVSWLRRLYRADPERQERTLCPLVVEGHCPLVAGADVVVSTTGLTDSREILATLSAKKSPALVVEGTSSDLERDGDVIGDAVELELPVLPRQLVEAVDRARVRPGASD